MEATKQDQEIDPTFSQEAELTSIRKGLGLQEGGWIGLQRDHHDIINGKEKWPTTFKGVQEKIQELRTRDWEIKFIYRNKEANYWPIDHGNDALGIGKFKAEL